uniref:Amino acid transporter n=1 Tax=Callorhinchus milii TaxID=7868 RepID=A0A4W3K6Z3_CALMI
FKIIIFAFDIAPIMSSRRAMSFNILCSLSYFLSLFPKGIIVGFLVREKGKLLMSMFRMSILPLVSSSVIAGLAGMDTKTTAKIGLRSMAYCLSSASTAIAVGAHKLLMQFYMICVRYRTQAILFSLLLSIMFVPCPPRYMPVGLFFLIASKIIEMDDWEIFKQLGLYITTVLGGHGGQNATLPVTFKSVEEKIGVSNTVSRVFLPLATTINLNGSALYQAVAVIFIARLFSPANSNVLIFSSSPNLTATVSSRAGSGVPSTGAVAMMTTLAAVGDRFRTMVTVLGDGIGAGIVDHLSIQDLK